MPKALNNVQVNLQFTADTSQAQQQLKQLQQTLRNLTMNPAGGQALSKEMAEASRYAGELAVHLQKATNTTTGRLDFTRLNESLKQSGMSLSQYGEKLLALGPKGKEAFSQLATSISQSEIPMRRMSNSLLQMGTVLKNTIRWQLSSTAIHAFSGAIQTAYNYAKDLNESLNNIRIVTGYNIDQMDKFAASANKAAKALSVSTLDYTKSALIYYQQGLSDAEVEARNNVTSKMANVTKQSAEEVSNQLTAIWNNYAKGSENLEYYADVITALGAATASSSQEIATGLEKFAAVGETVGLSYEYATAALATVTATTRQSAEVVGTAFKTLFARLQSLKLGETLDDETDLKSYSQALKTVGVNIKDASGGLKDMDTILDETAAKWRNLSKDQQMALAQTVAGVRQYTQFIALMDNWNFMQKNLQTAYGSTGTLQKQQDIYAESWEAASKRVKAASEELYQSLINDDFFIDFLNFTEKAVNGVNNLVKAFGGIPGVLSTIGVLITTVFQKQLIEGLTNLTYSLSTLTQAGYQKQVQKRDNELAELISMSYGNEDYTTKTEEAEGNALQTRLRLTQELAEAKSHLNDVEYAGAQAALQVADTTSQALVQATRDEEQAQNDLSATIEKNIELVYENGIANNASSDAIRKRVEVLKEAQEDITTFTDIESELTTILQDEDAAFEVGGTSLTNYIEKIQQVAERLRDLGLISEETFKKMQQGLNMPNLGQHGAHMITSKLSAAVDTGINKRVGTINRLTGTDDASKGDGAGQTYQKNLDNVRQSQEILRQKTEENRLAQERFIESLSGNATKLVTWQEGVIQASSTLMTFGMTFNSIKGIINTLNNEDMSFFEKLASISMSLGMVIPMVVRSLSGLPELWNRLKVTILAHNIAQQQGITVTAAANTIKGVQSALTKKEITEKMLLEAATKAGITVTEEEIAAGLAEAGTGATRIGVIKALIAAKLEEDLANKKAAASAWASLGPYVLIAAAIAAVVAVVYLAVKAYNKEAEAAKQAAEAAKSLQEKSNAAADAVNEIKDAFDGYDKAIDTLKKCTKGTEEWKNALQAVNDSVLDILENNPELASQLQLTRKNGYLEITNTKEIIGEAERKARAAQAATIVGNANAQQAQLVSDTVNLQRKYSMSDSIFQQALANWNNPAELEKVKNQLNWQYDSVFQNFVKDLTTLGRATERLATTMDNSSELLVENALGENFDEATKNIEEKRLNAEIDVIKQSVISQSNVIGSLQGKNDQNVANLWNRYLAATGEHFELTGNAVLGGPENRRFQYYQDGEKKEVTISEMASAIAAAEAIEKITQNAGKTQEILSSLNSKEYGSDLSNFFGNGYNFEGSTKQAIDQLTNLNKQDLLTMYGVKDEKEFESTFGISLDFVIEKLTEASTAFTSIGENLSTTPKYWFNTISESISSLTLGEQKQIAQSFQDVFNKLGPAATENYAKLFQELGKDFGDVFSTFDFANGTTEEFIESLQNAGIDTNNLSDDIIALANAMKKASSAALGLTDIMHNYKTMADIVDKLSTGSTISSEDYDKLIKENPNFADFFLRDISGDYNLISDPEAVRDFMKQTTQEQLDNAISILEQGKNNALLGTVAGDNSFGDTKHVDYDLVRQQLDFLNAAGAGNEDWETAYDEQQLTYEQLSAISEKIKELQTDEANYNELIREKNELNGTMTNSLADLNQYTKDQKINEDGVTAGLKKLGGQYEATIPLVQKLTKLEKEQKKGTDEYKDAQHELWQEIRKQEWAEVIGNIEKHIKAIADEKSSNEELRKAYTAIAKEFNEKFNLTLTPEQIAAHKQQFVDLANADAEQINDLALSIESMLAAEEAGVADTLVKIGDDVMSLKDYIEANPIQVDAEGHADMTGLIQGLLAAGATAEQVAAILAAIGQTNVTIAGAGTSVGMTFDKNDPASWAKFIDELNTYRGTVQAGGTIPKITGTGARDYTQKIGGGSGGGGGKQKKNDIERYHEIKDEIDNLQRAYDQLNKAKDRAWGQDKINLIQAEIDKTEDLIDAQKRYLEQIRENKALDDARAQQVAESLGFTDPYGQTNWTAIQQALEDARYNKTISEEDYTERKKFLDKYIETIELEEEQEDKLQELLYQQQDLIAEKLKAKIDLRIEINELDKKIIETQLKALGDKFYRRIEAGILLSKQFGTGYENGVFDISKVNRMSTEIADELAGWNEIKSQISQEAYVSGMKDVITHAANNIEELISLNEQMETYYSSALNQFSEDLERQIKPFHNLIEEFDHYSKLLELAGHEKDYDKMLDILDVQMSVMENQLDVDKETQRILQEEYDARKANYDARKKEYEDALAAGDAEAARLAQVGMEAAKDSLYAAQDALDEINAKVREDIEQIAEYAQQKFITTLDKIYDKSDKALTGGLGFDYLSQTMDLASKRAEEFLTKTNQIYETNVLLNKIIKDIDKTSNQAAKSRLNDFSKEIQALQEKGELSQYELKDAQARYEILKAQIALEEAQNAKSTIRLQRDTEGSYGYVYTADRDKIDEAQENLLKAQNDRYNLALETQQEYLRKFYDTEKEANDALRQLDEDYAAGRIASEEEYRAKRQQIIDYYSGLLEGYELIHTQALSVMHETSAQGINDSWTETFVGKDGLVGKSAEWRTQSVEDEKEVDAALKELSDTLDKIVEPEFEDWKKKIDDTKKASEELRDEMINKFLPDAETQIEKIGDISDAWTAVAGKIQAVIEKLEEYMQKAKLAAETSIPTTPDLPTLETPETPEVPPLTTTPGTAGSGGGGGIGSGGGTLTQKKYHIYAKIKNELAKEVGVYADRNDAYSRVEGLKAWYESQGYQDRDNTKNNFYELWISQFKSGGYTGDWTGGSELYNGKLAMLHEKELVLNQEDTKNMLAAVHLVREISHAVDLQAQMASGGNLSAPGYGYSNSVLEQTVTIHAEFPNAVNHNEIEEAFNNLVNRASQYANRK